MRKSIKKLAGMSLAALIAAAFLAANAPGSRADDGFYWTSQQPVPATDVLYSVSAADSAHVWASGSWGTIYFFDGSSWTPQFSDTGQHLQSVFAQSTTNVWAVGFDGDIVHFDGTGWRLEDCPTVERLNGVSAESSNHAWVVGDNGMILEKAGSNPWSIVTSPVTVDLNDVFARSPFDAWAVGDGGVILHWNGVSWSEVTPHPTTADLLDVTAAGANDAWAVGTGGTILHFDGVGWSIQATVPGASFWGVSALSSDRAWACTNGGRVYYYDGISWSLADSGGATFLFEIWALDESHVWGAGGLLDGAEMRFFDGATWADQFCPSDSNMFGVAAVDSTRVYAAGEPHGACWRYDGSGWTDMSPDVAGLNFRAVDALDAGHVWVAGDNHTVYFYDGTSWESRGGGLPATNFNGIFALDAGNVWVVGTGNRTIFRWDGSGWIPETPPAGPEGLFDVFALSENSVWAVGENGLILHYDGAGWQVQPSPVPDVLRGVCAVDPCNAWIVTDGGHVLHYDGASWQLQYSASSALLDVSAADAGHVWAVGSGGRIFLYDGSSWSEQVSGTTRDLYGVSASDTGYVWAVGQMGTVLIGQYPAPTVGGITPNGATNGGPVGITDLAGTGFRDGAAVKLTGSGQADICATNVNVVSADRITCDFDLTGKAIGPWNVVVTNPDSKSGTLENGFTVGQVSSEPPQQAPSPTVTSISPASGKGTVQVEITGRDFLDGCRATLGNTGTQAVEEATDIRVSDGTKITCSFDLTGAAPGAYDLTVMNPPAPQWPAGTLAGAFRVLSDQDTWYLAEGTTAWGFSTYIHVVNPNDREVTADITYMTGEGDVSGGTVTLPPMSQFTANPAGILGGADFSTRVQARGGEPIAVDRTMVWTGEGAPSPEGHCSIGVNSPGTTWYLPEGSSSHGFETWLLIQNPNGREAVCMVTYMIEGRDPVTVEKRIPANSRMSFDMARDIGAEDASIKVEGDVPVIPERAMYRNNRREGHCSIGTTAPATDYYLAEGATGYGPGYQTYVLVQNPQDSATDVSITYMTGTGETAGPSFRMAANSRKTVRVNGDLSPDTDVSARVHGTQPVVAERAMYWNNGSGEACHDSIGLPEAHTSFFMPDGCTSGGFETWTLVQNPNGEEVMVEVSYLSPTGRDNFVFEETIPASSRRTFDMSRHVRNGNAAVTVVSKTAGKKIIAERSMYWDNRGAGTDTIGGYAD